MKITTVVSLSAVMCLLAGCQSLPNTSGALKPVNVQAAKLTPGVPYYPVGRAPKAGGDSLAPSLLPPGQDLAPIKKHGVHVPTIVIKASMTQAWHQVNAALSKTRYSVMDKDEAMHVLYVLDRDLTQGKLTRHTPIYRLHLLQSKPGEILVQLSSGDSHALPDATKAAVLGALKKQLS